VSAIPEGIPEYIVPAPHGFGGVNFPYRGQQDHGVPPTETAIGSPDDYEGGSVEVSYEKPEEDIAPVPVRIVDTAAHEFTQWRAFQAFANASPTRVVNRKEGRDRVTIKNVGIGGPGTVWIGPDSNVSSMSGFRLDGNGDSVTLQGEAEVWAISDDPQNPVPLCIITEFSTAER
jgi:hypothetical protein